MLIATALLAAVLVAGDYFVMPYFLEKSLIWRLSGLALLSVTGAAVYFAMLYLTGVLSKDMLKSLFPKRKKQDTIGDVQSNGQ